MSKRIKLQTKGFERHYHVLLDGVKVGDAKREIASSMYTGTVQVDGKEVQVWGFAQKDLIAHIELYLI